MIIVILQRYLISEWIKGALSAEGSEKVFSFTPCWVIDKWRFYLGTFKSIYGKQMYSFLGSLLDLCYFEKADTIQPGSHLISVVPPKESMCTGCGGGAGELRERETGLLLCKHI